MARKLARKESYFLSSGSYARLAKLSELGSHSKFQRSLIDLSATLKQIIYSLRTVSMVPHSMVVTFKFMG